MNLWTPKLPSRMPQMPAAILFEARELTADGGELIVGGTLEIGGPADFNSATSSGKVLSGFHSSAPSICTSVSARRRFSAIHFRICSMLTGPYCWPSAPMNLYITCLSVANQPAAVLKFSHYILPGGFVIRGGMFDS